MFRLLKSIRRYMDQSLRRQLMFYLMIGVLLPLTIVTAVLFAKARQEMKGQAVVNIRQRSEEIAGKVDDLIYNIRSVSDKFAYAVELEEIIEKDYKGLDMERRSDAYVIKAYFDKTDLLNESERISAIYTKHGDVINFTDPYNDGEDIKKKMLDMGAMDSDSLSMFRWSPAAEDFLSNQEESGELRKRLAVTGVRRIFHPMAGAFMYTQFFSIPEQTIYETYSVSAKEMGGHIFITDSQGRLVSAYEDEVMESRKIPDEILSLAAKDTAFEGDLEYGGIRSIVSVKKLKNVDWTVISTVPLGVVTAPVDRLYQQIIMAMLLCVGVCFFLLTYISHRFLRPVDVLKNSMKQVYDGNLNAYVITEGYNGEIQSMMRHYNSMLTHINRFLEEQLENEQKKKRLELEVLMGQVNPHFLYNTLETIVWKSNEAGRPDIGRLAAALGRLYRLSISNGDINVKIQQELEHVMAYIKIQNNRYKERMEFELLADYEQLYDYCMIKLTLQPVVENCFMYGIDDIDHTLKIRLRVRVREEVIVFTVADNGVGLTREQLEEVRAQIANGISVKTEESRRNRKGTGIGLYSVKERIAIYTGYQNAVTIQSKKNVGTLVRITIPKILAKDKN